MQQDLNKKKNQGKNKKKAQNQNKTEELNQAQLKNLKNRFPVTGGSLNHNTSKWQTASPYDNAATQAYIQNFNDLCQQLHRHCIPVATKSSERLINSDLIFAHWISAYGNAMEQDYLSGDLEKRQIRNMGRLHESESLQQLYESFQFFKSPMWKLRFASKFSSKMFGFNKNQLCLLYNVMRYLEQGLFNMKSFEVNLVSLTTNVPYTAFYYCRVHGSKYLFFMVGIEKVPVFCKRSGSLIKFKIQQYMRFLDLIDHYQFHLLSSQALRVQKELAQDPQRGLDFSKGAMIQKSSHQMSNEHNNKYNLFHTEQGNWFNASGSQMPNILPRDIAEDRREYTSKYASQYSRYSKYYLNFEKYQYVPVLFDIEYLTPNEANNLVLETESKRWIYKDQKAQLEKQKFQAYRALLNKQMIERFADFSSAKRLVQLLQNIPNFKISLTEEESDVIGQSGNVMVIGRSGTGKTTCAILRLFSIEMLYKIRVAKYKRENQGLIKDTQFDADDVDSTMGLHCIFVTASPVLTNEVGRYYKKLTSQIKEELEKKKDKVRKEKRENNEQLAEDILEQEAKKQEELTKYQQLLQDLNKPLQEVNYKKEKEEIEHEMEEEFQDLKLEKRVSHESEGEVQRDQEEEMFDIDDLEEDEENDDIGITTSKKQNNKHSLNDLQEDDFPGFFTVKRLIMLIDACMKRPFFARNQNGEIIGQDSKSTWHNETKGVLMIDGYHKKMQSGKDEEEIKNIEEAEEQEDFDMGEYEDEEELEDEYRRQIEIQQKKAKIQESQKKNLKNYNAKRLAFEIDYDYFETHFWPQVAYLGNNHGITCDMVWTEIYSYIKGSASANLYVGWYVSKYVYVYNNPNKSNLLTQQQREVIHDIYLKYERWKVNLGSYDLMDIVNYLLAQIRYGNYNGQEIHYMMIDEVQDLPHAVLLLLMKVTQQGLFYSGDTAQTIAKGVGFRFCDLNHVFERSNFSDFTLQPPVVKHLTVNFRSHNKILELANSIVTTIEIFFPSTIDKLKKERSNIDGPKPILLANADPELLFFILCGEEQFKSMMHSDNKQDFMITDNNNNGGDDDGQKKKEVQPLEFGCNQVIIVRDQESKEKLPSVLQHALVLTVYEAKGLEFDDVILYNFFSDSKIDETQWKLLNRLCIEQEWVSKEEFLETITMHEKDRFNKLDIEEKDKNEEKEEQQQQDKKDVVIKEQPQNDSDSEEEESSDSEESDIDNNNNGDDDDEDKDKKKKEYQEMKKKEAKKKNMHNVGVFGMDESEDGEQICLKKVKKAKTQNKKEKKIKIQNYSALCTELKQLYVACTRPKNRLIIYDSDCEKRNLVSKYWTDLGVVEPITKEMIETSVIDQEKKETNDTNINESKEVRIFKSILNKTNAKEWRNQGLKMFKHKYFGQAMKCFEKAGEKEMHTKAKAYFTADQASKTLVEVQSELSYIEQKIFSYAHMKSHQKKIIKNQLKEKEKLNLELFREAGDIFLQCGKVKQAAQCYFSAKDFQKAADLYIQIGSFKQAGEAYFMMKKYVLAAEKYDQGGDYIRVIECFDIENRWDRILETMHKYQELIPEKDMTIFVRKYAPLALEALVSTVVEGDAPLPEIEQDNNDNSNAQNLSKDNKNGVIQEESEEEESSSESEESEEEEQEQQEEEKKDGEEIKEKVQEQEQNISDLDFSVVKNEEKEIEKSIIQQQKNDEISNLSFSILGKNTSEQQEEGNTNNEQNISSLSFSQLNPNNNNQEESQLEDFDHLSHLDLQDDEWLKMEKGSIIDSISEARKSQNSNLFSEYSAVEMNDAIAPNVQLVKTKGDIFIQDSVMQSIISYINMFDQNLQKDLKKMRSHNSLITQRADFKALQSQEIDNVTDFIVDLDNIDIDFVYKILDVLEAFKIYKLCIFVCNRYKLAQRLGRYVLSLGQKYSNLSNENATLSGLKLNAGRPRQQILEKGYVSGYALHNVLENINPEYLKGKKEGEDLNAGNSLGMECYQGLVLLGYWKKVLYMLDFSNALALASAFGDFRNYKIIYLTMKENKPENVKELVQMAQQPCFEFLPFQKPEKRGEIELCFVALEHYIVDQIRNFKNNYLHNPFLMTNYQQELRIAQINKKDQKEEVVTFPSYFAYNGVLWNYLNNNNQEYNEDEEKKMVEYLVSGFQNLHKILTDPLHIFQSDIIELRILDLITFAVMVCNAMSTHQRLQSLVLNRIGTNEFFEIFDCIFQIFRILSEQSIVNRHSKTLLRGLFAPYGVRLIDNEEVLNLINNNHVLVHRGSSIIGDLQTFRASRYQMFNEQKVDTKNKVFEEIFFSDLDHEYIMAPLDVVLILVKEKIYGRVQGLLNSKITSLKQVKNCSIQERERGLNRENLSEKAYNLSAIMGLLILKGNLTSMFQNSFKENLQEKQEKNKGNQQQLEAYKKLRHNDIVRRYMKLARQKEDYDVVEGDEDIEEYLRLNPHLNASKKLKKQKKQQQKLKKKNISVKEGSITGIPEEKKELNAILSFNLGKSERKLHSYIKEALLMLVQYYMKKGLENGDIDAYTGKYSSQQLVHNYIVKARRILGFMGSETMFSEYLRLIRKTFDAPKSCKAYRNLDDYLVLKQYGQIADYSDCLFDYFAQKFSSAKPEERLQNIEESIVLNLIAYKQSKKGHQYLITGKNWLQFIPKVQFTSNNNNEGSFETNIISFNSDEILAECVFWLKKIVDNKSYLTVYKHQLRIFKLCFLILFNIDTSCQDLFFEVYDIIQQVVEQNPADFSYFTQSDNYDILNNIENIKDFKEKETFFLKNDSEDACFRLESEIDDSLYNMNIYKLEIINKANAKASESASLSDYYKDMYLQSRRLNAKRTIFKYVKQYHKKNTSKARSKIIKSPIIIYTFAQSLNINTSNAYLKNINKFSIKYQSVLEVFRDSERTKRQILNTFMQTYVEIALDFHYIALQLRSLCQEKNKFMEQMKGVLVNYKQEDIDLFVKQFVAYKKDLADRTDSFEAWQKANVKFEANVNKLIKKKQRIYSVKWINRRNFSGNKLMKLAKKRAGLKKQRALESKRDRLKGF